MAEKTTACANSANWYVVHCKPTKEVLTASFMREFLGLKSYLPLVAQRSQRNTDGVPLFMGYIFVHADLRLISVSSINASPGVLKLLAFDGNPQPVQDEVITALQQRVEDLNKLGGLPTHAFQPGDAVLIKTGPLRGISAIFTGPTTPSERVSILFDFMGQPQQMPINVTNIENGATRPIQRPERGTRGKGRTINRNRREQLSVF